MNGRPGATGARLLLLLLLLLGLLAHLDLRKRLGDFVDADEAVLGLMARHIATGASRPAFYYGQPYLGSLEAWIGAASGLGEPPTTASIRLALVLIWAGLALATAGLARAAGASAFGAALALGMVALVPPEVLFWHLRFRGGFLLGAALLAGALWAAAGCRSEPASTPRAIAFGLLAGLAFWTNQLAAPPLLMMAVAVGLRSRRRSVLIAAFLIGSAPLWVYNLIHPLATFRYLAAHALANAPQAVSHTRALIDSTLPWLFGGVAAAEATGRPGVRFAGPAIAGLGVALWLGLRLRPMVHDVRMRRPLAFGDLLVLALLVTLPARRNAELNQVLQWTPLVAALLGALPARLGRRGLLLLPAALIGLAALEWGLKLPGFAASGYDATTLVARLDALGIRSIWAEHRSAYLVAWHSGERIVASPVLSYGYFVDRYPPYTRAVAADPGAAWVLEAGSPAERRFGEVLRAHGSGALPERVSIYHLYTGVTVPAQLLSAGGVCGRIRSAAPPGAIRTRVLLAGDAGHPWTAEALRVTEALRRDASDPRARERVVVWLGDNVYSHGFPAAAEAAPDRAELAAVLDQQIDLVRDSGARMVMIPGNHDWDYSGPRGWGRVLGEAQRVQERGYGFFARYLPGGACPGPESLEIDGLRLIALDSEWFLRPEGGSGGELPLKPEASSERCLYTMSGNAGAADPWAALANLLDDPSDADTLVVAHHPVRTHGPHGTRGGARPGSSLPCLSQQDLCGEGYQRFARVLDGVLAQSPRRHRPGLLLIAGGHDHSLQVLEGERERGPDRYLVSGAASDPTRVERGPDTRYASARHGYLRLDRYPDGQRWLSVIEAGAEGDPCLAFEERLVPGGD